MTRKNLIFFALVILAFAGCKKSNNDAASKWVGTYNAIAGGGVTNTNINQVVVQESNSFTLRMALNNVSSNTFTTYVTLVHVNLGSDSCLITESDSTTGYYSQLTYTGSATLNNDTLRLLCIATDSTHYIPFNFRGLKQ